MKKNGFNMHVGLEKKELKIFNILVYLEKMGMVTLIQCGVDIGNMNCIVFRTLNCDFEVRFFEKMFIVETPNEIDPITQNKKYVINFNYDQKNILLEMKKFIETPNKK